MDSLNEASSDKKLLDKIKKNPIVPLGLFGLTAVAAYGIYNFKNRKDMRPSVYLIHLRLAAQGTLMGTLTLGLAYTLYKNENIWKVLDTKK